MRSNLFRNFVSLLLLLVFPALLLMTKGGNLGFYLLLVCAVIQVFHVSGCRISFRELISRYWYFHLGMAALLIATVSGQLFALEFSAKVFDEPSRLAVFPLILWLLLSLSPRQLRIAQAGYMLGAIVGAIFLYYGTGGGLNRDDVHGAPIIVFSNIALLLGMLSLATMVPGEHLLLKVARFVGCVAGIYASYISQARGSWVAIFFLILLASYIWEPRRRHVTVGVVVAMLMIGWALVSTNSIVKARLHDLNSDIVNIQNGTNLDSSLGTRLQLWNGSLVMFKEHPLFGIGPGKFKEGLQDLKQRKIITPLAAENFYHSHNDILFYMSTIGLIGLAGILMTYIGPAIFFFKYLQCPDTATRRRAGAGLLLIAGYFIFGLTDCFFWGLSFTFYCLSLVTIAAPLIQDSATQSLRPARASAS